MRLTRIADFTRASLHSRPDWTLVCLHAAWFFLAIANMSPPSHAFAKLLEHVGSTATIFAGRPFHFAYESGALQFLVVADLPSMIAEIPFGLLAMPLLRLFPLDLYSGSNVDASLMVLVASCKWLAVGNFLESRLLSCNWGDQFSLGRIVSSS